MWQDLRFGVRTLGKSPGFTAVAVIALALGIGANATVFSLVNAILYKSLPFPDSGRVLYIASQDSRNPNDQAGVSLPEYDDLRAQLRSFAGLAAAGRTRVNLSDDVNAPDGYTASEITANAFSVVGLPPLLGRDFSADDARPGAAAVAMLTYDLWQKRYGKDPSVVGRKIRVNTVPTTIVGISAAGLAIPAEAQLWVPYIPDPKSKRDNRRLTVFGKLAPGISRTAAQSELSVVSQRLATEYPETTKNQSFRLQGFNDLTVRGPIRIAFLALLGAVGFVLLIACANVANLMLSRAAGRAREISIRAALGAGRWRVVRQLLAESLLLSVSGGLIGLAIANWGIRAFDAAVVPTGKPAWINFAMDYRVFAYLAAITAITAVLFGLAPAIRLSRMDIHSTLKEGGRAGIGLRGRYLSSALVVIEMTLAVVLLTGAGLMIRSFLMAYARHMGIDTSNILTLHVELPAAKYGKPAEQLEFQRHLIERLRAVAGVQTAAVTSSVFGSGTFTFPYEIDGQPLDPGHRKSVNFLLAGDGYFETLGLAAIRGRLLNSADYASGPNVAVVNQTMARQLWPNQDAVGRRFRLFGNSGPSDWITVAGVVPDFLQVAPRNGPQAAAVLPYRYEPHTWMSVLLRTRIDAASLGNTVRREVEIIDPDLPVRDFSTLDDQLALSRWPLRVFGTMFTIFAGAALMLATVGLYAVVAYGVSQRTQEIGVRIALGASGSSVLRMVFAGGMLQALLGLVLGLAAAFGVTRVLSSILIGVSTTDPLTFGAVAAILLAAAILGCLIPAQRATRVDPMIALRNE